MEEPTPNQQPPSDVDLGSMEMVGIELHEIYLTLKRCGFDENQALFIVGIAVSEGAMSPRRYFSSEDTPPNSNDIDDDDDFPDDGDFNPFF
jgi:hypothetical protein